MPNHRIPKTGEIVSNIENKIDPKVTLSLLGISDLDLAKQFAQEFAPEVRDLKVPITLEEEKRLSQKASVLKFSRITNLLALLRRDLLSLSQEGLFTDQKPGELSKPIINQNIFSKELLEKKAGVLKYIGKARGRCEILIEFLEAVTPKDSRIQETLDLLNFWLPVFDEIASIFAKVSQSELEEYQKALKNGKRNIKKIIELKLNQSHGKINPEEVTALLSKLDPSLGTEIATKIVDEYLDTSLTLNTMRILHRLSQPLSERDTDISETTYPETNFPELKFQIKNLYSDAQRVRDNPEYSEPLKKALLESIDNNFFALLQPLGNKIGLIFPHKHLAGGSSLIEILADENAICAGKTQIIKLVGDYLGLKESRFAVSGNGEIMHAFNIFQAPSSNDFIFDANTTHFNYGREDVDIFRFEDMEIGKESEARGVVYDYTQSSYRFIRFTSPKRLMYEVHESFRIYKAGNSLIPPLEGNFLVSNTIQKFNSFLKNQNLSADLINSQNIKSLSKRYFSQIYLDLGFIDEELFISYVSNPQPGFSLLGYSLAIEFSLLKKFQNKDLLREIYRVLANEAQKNPIILKYNANQEREKLNYLRQFA